MDFSLTVNRENCAVNTSSTSRANLGTRRASAQAKVEHPANEYSDPSEVVADPALSTHEKLAALNALEQDARQLATASEEGMSGGEETKLRRVLQAKRSLELPTPEVAFAVVSQFFEDELRETVGTEAHTLVVQAMDAITAARDAIEERGKTPAPPPGAPEPGSTDELEEELEKEKLDPGA
jgi:hypothetical protein